MKSCRLNYFLSPTQSSFSLFTCQPEDATAALEPVSSARDRAKGPRRVRQERDDYSSFPARGREGDELFPWDLISLSPSCRKTGIVVPLFFCSSRPLSPVSSAANLGRCSTNSEQLKSSLLAILVLKKKVIRGMIFISLI